MPKTAKPTRPLTPLELRIMQVLWNSPPLNVQAVQEALGTDLAYTTVQTMLNILHRKGHVTRQLVGRAYQYRPLQNRETARRGAVRDLLHRMFNGSADDLVMNMLETRQIDPTRMSQLLQKFAVAEREADADRH